MAKEHGLEEHKGVTIPKEVRSLADRIRKKENVSDEYAYRTAWDIFRSHTAEGKSYPHKSPESGLAREGGGTGPIEKKGSDMSFWNGFEKRAAELTTERRKDLPKSDFGLPEEEKYPMPDKRHAANAVARVAQHGTPSEREEVRRKAYEKYPELKEHFKEQHGGKSPTSKEMIKKEKLG